MEQPPSPPLGETPLASPVTVMHPCGCAEGIRAPSRCQHARTMRAEATVVLLNAYCQLVRHANWCATDIHETEARRTPAFRDVVVRSPEQDALGVLAGANAVMRYVLSDDALLEHNLDIEVRYWLAAILFSVYKVKTEERWEQGHSMTMLVLEQFLLVHELGEWRTCPHTRADHERRMWTAEATLIADQPFGALVDRGVHGAFEVACAQLMQLSVLTERDGELAVGLVHFYLHATYVNAKRDLLEELCADLGTEGGGRGARAHRARVGAAQVGRGRHGARPERRERPVALRRARAHRRRLCARVQRRARVQTAAARGRLQPFQRVRVHVRECLDAADADEHAVG